VCKLKYLVHLVHPVVVNSNTQKVRLTHQHLKMYIYIIYEKALHVSTLKGSSSGAESNELTTHISRHMRTRNSDKKDTI
jgi:hypothetical protein